MQVGRNSFRAHKDADDGLHLLYRDPLTGAATRGTPVAGSVGDEIEGSKALLREALRRKVSESSQILGS